MFLLHYYIFLMAFSWLYGAAKNKWLVFSISSHKIDYMLHHWFKSYVDFAEWVDSAYWWSFIGKGTPAACVRVTCYSVAQLLTSHYLTIWDS